MKTLNIKISRVIIKLNEQPVKGIKQKRDKVHPNSIVDLNKSYVGDNKLPDIEILDWVVKTIDILDASPGRNNF